MPKASGEDRNFCSWQDVWGAWWVALSNFPAVKDKDDRWACRWKQEQFALLLRNMRMRRVMEIKTAKSNLQPQSARIESHMVLDETSLQARFVVRASYPRTCPAINKPVVLGAKESKPTA